MFQLTPTVRNLLIANVVVFFAAMQLNPLAFLALYPIGSPLFQPWQFLTYMFMHANLGHIFSNMLGLVVFGPMLEQRWGAKRFLTYWLICGLGAGILYNGLRTYEVRQMRQDIEAFRADPTDVNLMDFVDHNASDYRDQYAAVVRQLHATPDDQGLIRSALESMDYVYQRSINGPMVGASGALFGLMLAFAFYFPNTPLIIFPLPFPIKAKYLVVLYGLYELYTGVHQAPGDNVAHFAHLGGLLVGLIVLLFWQRNRTRMY
ncbi:rhomboid family intramembrane serine protease [Hymenobacter taeanensis]|uniref:Rhomboid family intramembrane serine protease n=1 Tax=Hymenobacter taeanensis TaxID=2735321 RepID=A0A6M6BHZ8_9BACT|nr:MULTISPECIES: rhomboid family intramembrane serine protease [Hymenobacter]QJX47602.1 rhomboid family intramembrane serine protease [Hymenobacter taeanensis]UOQ82914.1 rhomboid family intramembrane serine protease [Hymenobacter sp. 5414T-23]